jgi:hypothetical protein
MKGKEMYRKLFTAAWALTIVFTYGIVAQTTFRLGGDSTDYGKDITVDKSGNAIVVGYFFGTVDFDPSVGVHNLISSGKIDNFIVKYGATGDYKWAIKFGGVGEDAPSSVKTDDAGNIYVCGYFSGQIDFFPGVGTAIRTSNGLRDGYVAKYDSGGSFLWVNTFGSDSNDEVIDLRLDRNGNVFVTGSFQETIDVDPGPGIVDITSNGQKDIFLLKYTSEGNLIWGFNVGGAGNDEGMAVVPDSSGDCYLSGYFSQTVDFDPGPAQNDLSSSGNTDIFFCKYSSSGVFQWGKSIGGKSNDSQSPGGLTLDAEQNVYIAGDFSSTINFEAGEVGSSLTSRGNTDIFVAKYAVDGTFQKCFGFGGADQDHVSRISVDIDGAIYLAGSFKGTANFDPGTGSYLLTAKGTNGASDIFVAKYNLFGSILWADGIGASTSNPNDLSIAASVVVDGSSNCYASGKFYRTADFDPTANIMNFVSAGSSDIFVVKLSGDGALWTSLNAPIANISPKSLNLGYVLVDSTRQSIFNVFNIGDVNLVISSVYSTNSKFSVSPSSATIIPLQAEEFTITFSPTDSGYQEGWIILEHNAINHKDSVLVRGEGIGYLDHVIFPISSGWNMISIPLVAGSGDKNILFPTAISDAFAFTPTGYLNADTMKPGNGYWLKFDSSQVVVLSGRAINADTINVIDGWNLIGSLAYPISTSSIIEVPASIITSPFFDFSVSYNEATILQPGKGYWVKVNHGGVLILSTP